jgi:hypothetical protein
MSVLGIVFRKSTLADTVFTLSFESSHQSRVGSVNCGLGSGLAVREYWLALYSSRS